MHIEVNGQLVETGAATLLELVEQHAGSGLKVATALNGQFVSAAGRASVHLKPGDKIEIVSPRQGG